MAEAGRVQTHDGAVPLAPVVRLHSIRTLVIARDLAFRRRAMTVLGELGWVGFAIAGPEGQHDLVGIVRGVRADVVVLDATACAPAAGRIVADLADLVPHVGVVVVSEEEQYHRPEWMVVPKWGWAADLIQAVQVARRDAQAVQQELFHGH